MKILPGSVEVLDMKGRNFAGAIRTEKTDIVATVRSLPRGAYTVRWHAISSDSHVVSGVWTFGVRVPAPAVVDAYGAGGPTTIEHVVRWLWFLALALTIGSLGFRLICLRGLQVPLALERRLAVAAGLGVVVALQVGIAAFSLRAEDALQLSFGKFLYGDLSPMTQTRFGQAFIVMTMGFAVVLALIFLSWLMDRVVLLVPAFVFSIVLTAGLSVSGHDGVDVGSSWLTEVADWVHITGASLWIGGLATMVALVWYGAPELRRVAFFRFSRLAMVLVAVVLTAGTYLSVVRLPHLRDLWTQEYGQVLLVKIALVSVALAWGGVHHFFVRPRLEKAGDAFGTASAGACSARASSAWPCCSSRRCWSIRSRRRSRSRSLPPRRSAAELVLEQLAQASRVGRCGRRVLVAEIDVAGSRTVAANALRSASVYGGSRRRR